MDVIIVVSMNHNNSRHTTSSISKFLQLRNEPARCLKLLCSSAKEALVCLLLGTTITLDKLEAVTNHETAFELE